ncbi:hypothetical protein [Rubrivirga sp. IMCC45206]|uniref:hypothetical protein n=1 Tax=Rubrivirga sp. IMCC45206 TaxID=3391614 RepID=UPI0039900052
MHRRALTPALLLVGCVGPSLLADDPITSINALADTRDAVVRLVGGEAYPARALVVAPDSASWLAPDGVLLAVATVDIEAVTFPGPARDLDAWATLGGAAVGVGLGVATVGDQDPSQGLVLTLGAGLVGAFVGTVVRDRRSREVTVRLAPASDG